MGIYKSDMKSTILKPILFTSNYTYTEGIMAMTYVPPLITKRSSRFVLQNILRNILK